MTWTLSCLLLALAVLTLLALSLALWWIHRQGRVHRKEEERIPNPDRLAGAVWPERDELGRRWR